MKTSLLVCCVLFLVACTQINEKTTCTDPNTGAVLTLADAISAAKQSPCSAYTFQTEETFCNNNSGTWWIPINAQKEGCNPACVVWAHNNSTEINWRCTGLLQPN